MSSPLLSQITGRFHRYLSLMPSNAKGIALALISTCMFVYVGVLVRLLNETFGIFQILLFRQLIFIAVLIPAMSQNLPALLKPRLVGIHAIRILGAFSGLYFGFLTVSNLPLADATALGFTQVLFVAVIARTVLAESVNMERLTTILVGFAGVMMVVQPSFEQTSIYILTGLGAALGAAVAVSCVRRMVQTEPRIVILAYQAVFVGLLALIPALAGWHWPTAHEWLLLSGVGGISSLAQWISINAVKWGEANVIANVEYAKMIYSMLLGYFLFAEIPNTLAFIGAAIIISSVAVPQLFRRQQSAN